jgi:ATP-dependent DNA helicase 2 subunit 1
LALDEEIPEKPEDKTIPKYRQIDKRVGVETTEWGKALDTAFKNHLQENPDAASTGSKRPTSNSTTFDSTKTGQGKKIKAEDTRSAVDEVQIRQLWQKGNLGKLTVAELKDFAAMKKIPITGRKADIVEKMEAWLESK